jgi:hypothetical protein
MSRFAEAANSSTVRALAAIARVTEQSALDPVSGQEIRAMTTGDSAPNREAIFRISGGSVQRDTRIVLLQDGAIHVAGCLSSCATFAVLDGARLPSTAHFKDHWNPTFACHGEASARSVE